MILWKDKFLNALLATGSVDKAATQAGISSSRAYLEKSKNHDFESDWNRIRKMIREARADRIEESMTLSATGNATSEKVTPMGSVVEVREAPDTFAGSVLLKGYRPGTFREKPPVTAAEFQTIAELFKAVAEAKNEGSLPADTPPALPPAEPEQQAIEATVVQPLISEVPD